MMKDVMKSIVYIMVAILLPTAIGNQAQAQTISANIKTTKAATSYTNKDLDWTIKFPKGWTQDNTQENQILVLKKGEGKSVLKASLHPASKANDDVIKNYIGFLKKRVKANTESIDMNVSFRDGKVTMHGKEFHYMHYTVRDDQGQVGGMYNSYYRIINGQIFEVAINTEDTPAKTEIMTVWEKSVKTLK